MLLSSSLLPLERTLLLLPKHRKAIEEVQKKRKEKGMMDNKKKEVDD